MGELATILRAWRDRLSPQDVGLPAGGTRRASGLRREELAALAGVSVDYLVRLEQGRADSPSAQVVGALGRALQLSRAELEHLYRSAGLLPPSPTQVPTHITPGVQRLLLRLTTTPVGVYTAAWTLISVNPLWRGLFGDRPVGRGRECNLAWQRFTSPRQGGGDATRSPQDGGDATRSPHGGGQHLDTRSVVRHSAEERRRFDAGMVADLRAVATRYPDDAELHAMLAELRRTSGEFAELWQGSEMGHFHAERKTIDNRHVGPITLDCDVLTAPGTDLRIVAYTATPGSEDASKLELLGVAAVAAT